MTDLDNALSALREKPEDHKAQSGFYDLFLNSPFYIPTTNEMVSPDGEADEEEIEVPLILENEGTDFLVFFDEQNRLNAWAEQEAPYVKLPGHVLAEMTTDNLHWAMNIGTDHFKEFVPDEIAWLKDVVARCKAEGDKEESNP